MRHRTHTDHDHLSLPQLLAVHFQRLIHGTGLSKESFAREVREQHERRIPPAARTIEWSTRPDPIDCMKRDAEKVSRWLDDDVQARFPLEVFESFVLAFPEPRRLALQQEIAARSHLLVWPMPMGGDTEDCAELGALCAEAGEAIKAVSGLLADGRIDENDRHAAPAVLQEIDEAMAALIAMRERIEHRALRRRRGDAAPEPAGLRRVK